MSTISGLGASGPSWPDPGAMKQRMFNRVDSDGSGSVDKSELQSLLDNISQKFGDKLGSADDLMSKMDSDGNGSLSSDELDAGMKSLMPPPSSTVDFAQQRGGEMGGMPPPPPPPDDGGSSSTSSTSSSSDPLDLNGDGSVSAQERAAGELKNLLGELTQVLQKALSKAYDDGAADAQAGSSSASTQGLSLTA